MQNNEEKAEWGKRLAEIRKNKYDPGSPNHDVSHCSDYNPDTCPKSCFRAQVTADLFAREDLVGLPFSFMAFHTNGDPECPLAPSYVKNNHCRFCHEDLDDYPVRKFQMIYCPVCGRRLRDV